MDKKAVASPGSIHDTGCLGLVHWDDPEGWYGVLQIMFQEHVTREETSLENSQGSRENQRFINEAKGVLSNICEA